MGKWIILLVDLPSIIISICVLVFIAKKQMNCAESPFVCPNCGKPFYVKWYQLYVFRYFTVLMNGKAALKCPRCGKRDQCRWTGKDNS